MGEYMTAAVTITVFCALGAGWVYNRSQLSSAALEDFSLPTAKVMRERTIANTERRKELEIVVAKRRILESDNSGLFSTYVKLTEHNKSAEFIDELRSKGYTVTSSALVSAQYQVSWKEEENNDG